MWTHYVIKMQSENWLVVFMYFADVWQPFGITRSNIYSKLESQLEADQFHRLLYVYV